MKIRIGAGYDIHRLVKGRKLILGGVEISHHSGLLGHSDADVLTHAISDAILGALGLPNIGEIFPDTEIWTENMESKTILLYARNKLEELSYTISNLDAVIIAQEPKLSPHIEKMRLSISSTLGMAVGDVGLKAVTNERIGEIGHGDAIAAMANALILFAGP
ncbi:MAG: 2-C-methyl-D-erythritol 2,4-cyclodiphosphate synthase [Puniceicoccales bacterium]|jgi:2-C-methyl-D-erythritol 2,4-cyclodiphosphate synthase|nr:2-C-methyl-D-erythritol 2,4-cyclodiphosphate synthase [Puniceicoccales bacterium]